MIPEHDNLCGCFKQPFGALTPGQTCRLCLLIRQADCQVRTNLVIFSDDGIVGTYPMAEKPCRDGLLYSARFSLKNCGVFFYRFQIIQGREEILFASEEQPWQLTVCPEHSRQPSPWAGKVAYQVFPDRFCREGTPSFQNKLRPFSYHEVFDAPAGEQGLSQLGNADFYGGNFAGITKKLEYLQEFGVQVLYLNPICMALSSHRYDTADYLRPDPMLGTEEDFQRLCIKAHSLGMKVLLDGVFSHTGSISRYFDQDGRFGGGAASDPDSAYRSWYSFQHWPEQYAAWWGIPSLPCLNEMEPSLLRFLITDLSSVVRHWLRLGADGFRLDVADELPDEFLRCLYRVVHEEKPEGMVIGEVWEDASNKISYDKRRTYFTAFELDGVMNYPWRSIIIELLTGNCTAPQAAGRFMTLADHYPAWALHQSLISLSTHDTPRILTVFLENQNNNTSPGLESAKRMEQTAAMLQFFLPGVPCIYYGDEAGAVGGPDPDNRRPYPWGREDRILMKVYRSLAALRNGNRALQIGSLEAGAYAKDLLWLRRQWEGNTVTLLVNVGQVVQRMPWHGNTELLHLCNMEGNLLRLSPYGAAILSEHTNT